MPHTLINDLVNKWCGAVVFGTSFVRIVKVGANMNGALFLEDRNGVGHPSGAFDGVNETGLPELIDFSFDGFASGWVNGSQFLTDRSSIWPCVNVVFNNG